MSSNLLSNVQTILNSNVTLNESEKRFIQKLMTDSPQFFTDIDIVISEIIQDGKINIHDIPNIILLISKILKSYCLKVKNMNIKPVVSFLVNTIIDLLPISEDEEKTAKYITNVSISLLETNLNSIEDNVSSCCRK